MLKTESFRSSSCTTTDFIFISLCFLCFLIANFGQCEIILHNLNKVQYTVWISALYPAFCLNVRLIGNLEKQD